jgi:hypothetical protein
MKYRFIDEVIDGKKQHVHTLGGAPLIGTTAVVGVISKPLTWWASGLAVAELGWLNQKENEPATRLLNAQKMQNEIVGMSPEEYLQLLNRAYRAHADSLNKSAGKGTNMHAELETYIKACLTDNHGEPSLMAEYKHPAVERFALWSVKNVKRFIVSEGYTYSERLWIGGIIDCVAEMKDGIAIIDFKSSREAYVSQFIQTALYDIQMSESGIYDSDGNMIHDPLKAEMYYVFPFGTEKAEPSVRRDTDTLREAGEAAVKLYKITNLD